MNIRHGNLAGKVLVATALMAALTGTQAHALLDLVNWNFETVLPRSGPGNTFDGTLNRNGYGSWNNANTTDLNIVQDGSVNVNPTPATSPGWKLTPSGIGRNYLDAENGVVPLAFGSSPILYSAGGRNVWGGGGNDAGLYQDIGITTAGEVYRVNFDVGQYASGTAGYWVQLQEIAGASTNVLGQVQSTVSTALGVTRAGFVASPAVGGGTLRLLLIADGTTVGDSKIVLFDNFSIPEPATTLLFGVGGLLMWWRRHRS
jgi:hypothetical protein